MSVFAIARVYLPTFLEDNNVAEDLDVDTAVLDLDEPGENLAHGLAARLDVHCADA